MVYILGAKSRLKLQGVHRDLVHVVQRAIDLTSIDFGVLQGLRTLEEEQKNLDAGLSRIDPKKSRHLTGHAVDVGAYYNSVLTWDWHYYEQIADAFKQASIQLGTPIRWGGMWDDELQNHPYTSCAQLHKNYVERFIKDNPGRKPLMDGGHFELPTRVYP